MDKPVNEVPDIPVNQIKTYIKFLKSWWHSYFRWVNRGIQIKQPLGKKEIQLYCQKYVLGLFVW